MTVKKQITFITLFIFPLLWISSKISSALIPIDSIKVVVYGPEKTDLITESDVRRPGIDGSTHTIEDMMYERLMFQEAMRFNIISDEDALDTYLREIQREQGMTTEDLKNIFRQAGYTYAEGKVEFGRIKAVNQIVNVRVLSQLAIPKSEVEAYYTEHPQIQLARYNLQHAVAPVPARASERDKERIKNKLVELAEQDNNGDKIAWTDPYWLSHDEVAEDKQFIYTLEGGHVSDPYEIPDGFLVFKLLEKEDAILISLEDSYQEIVELLRQPKFVQRFEEYKQELKDNASFIFF